MALKGHLKLNQSSAFLEKRMKAYDKNQSPQGEKEAIINRAVEIASQYKKISTAANEQKSVDITDVGHLYYDWGMHLKELAFFYWSFPEVEHYIDTAKDYNNKAIDKLKQAQALYIKGSNESAANQTKLLIEAYERDSTVIDAWLKENSGSSSQRLPRNFDFKLFGHNGSLIDSAAKGNQDTTVTPSPYNKKDFSSGLSLHALKKRTYSDLGEPGEERASKTSPNMLNKTG